MIRENYDFGGGNGTTGKPYIPDSMPPLPVDVDDEQVARYQSVVNDMLSMLKIIRSELIAMPELFPEIGPEEHDIEDDVEWFNGFIEDLQNSIRGLE